MRKHKYLTIAVLGLAINLIETWLFGWHWKAQSGAESFWDSLSIILVAWGVIGDILTGVRIHKHYNNVTNIKTDNVDFKDGAKIMSYNVGVTNNKKK